MDKIYIHHNHRKTKEFYPWIKVSSMQNMMDDFSICGYHPWMKSTYKEDRWHTWTQPMWFVSWLVNKFDITQVPFAQLPLIIDQWKTTFALPDGFPWEGYGLINSLIFRRESWFSYRRSMNPHKVCNMKKLITILCFTFDLHHYNS